MNQEMETALRCLSFRNPSSWSKQLIWELNMRITHSTAEPQASPRSSVSRGYQHPLFPEQVQEARVLSPGSYPPVLAHLDSGHPTLLCSSDLTNATPTGTFGLSIWRSTRDLPLWVESKKLVPRFAEPFPISRVINHAAVQLRLPRSVRIHPTIHVSLLFSVP